MDTYKIVQCSITGISYNQQDIFSLNEIKVEAPHWVFSLAPQKATELFVRARGDYIHILKCFYLLNFVSKLSFGPTLTVFDLTNNTELFANASTQATRVLRYVKDLEADALKRLLKDCPSATLGNVGSIVSVIDSIEDLMLIAIRQSGKTLDVSSFSKLLNSSNPNIIEDIQALEWANDENDIHVETMGEMLCESESFRMEVSTLGSKEDIFYLEAITKDYKRCSLRQIGDTITLIKELRNTGMAPDSMEVIQLVRFLEIKQTKIAEYRKITTKAIKSAMGQSKQPIIVLQDVDAVERDIILSKVEKVIETAKTSTNPALKLKADILARLRGAKK